MSKIKRTSTGAMDAAELKAMLESNPHVKIDENAGKDLSSKEDLDALLAEEGQQGKTAAQRSAEADNQQVQDLQNNPPDTAEGEAETAGKLTEEQKNAQRLARDQAKAKSVVDARTKRNMTSAQKGLGKVNAFLDTGAKAVGGIADRIASASTVGGIGLLLVILVFLLFVVVKVNQAGDTRMKQLWYMLIGRTVLEGRVKPVAGDASQIVSDNQKIANAGINEVNNIVQSAGSFVVNVGNDLGKTINGEISAAEKIAGDALNAINPVTGAWNAFSNTFRGTIG